MTQWMLGSTPSLVDVVRAAKQHEIDHPSHGVNCACMDELVRAVRRMTLVEGSQLENMGDGGEQSEKFFASGSPYRQQQRVDYVFRAGTTRRS